jgi:excisionase family DNA binding protein
MTSTVEPALLTIPEACARLRISRATFYREVERGRIRTVPIGRGRNRRVTPDALTEYVRRLNEEADEGL